MISYGSKIAWKEFFLKVKSNFKFAIYNSELETALSTNSINTVTVSIRYNRDNRIYTKVQKACLTFAVIKIFSMISHVWLILQV